MRENKGCMKIDEKKVAWKVLKVIGMVLLGIVVVALLGFVIKWLWNWLMPNIFDAKRIGYWQALGIFALGKLIFGGISGHREEGRKSDEGTIRHAIRSEIKKEFDKEFEKEYGKDEEAEDKSDPDYDEIYEKWWEREGEKSFEKYMKNPE